MSLPPSAVKWASCIEDPRKVFVISCKCHRLSTVVQPLTEHLIGQKWSRMLFVPDLTSPDLTSPIWGVSRFEIRVLNFRFPADHAETPVEFWKNLEQRTGEALKTVKRTLVPSSSLNSLSASTEELGYLGLVGGLPFVEDWAGQPSVGAGEAGRRPGRRWSGLFGWQSSDGERKAWGESGMGEAQDLPAEA